MQFISFLSTVTLGLALALSTTAISSNTGEYILQTSPLSLVDIDDACYTSIVTACQGLQQGDSCSIYGCELGKRALRNRNCDIAAEGRESL